MTASFDWSNPAVVTLLARCAEKHVTRITVDHCDKSPKLCEVARYYVETYQGTSAFMVNIHNKQTVGIKLSNAQLAAALNCMLNDAKRQSKQGNQVAFEMPVTVSKNCAFCGRPLLIGQGVEVDEGWICADRQHCKPTAEQIADYPLDPIGALRYNTPRASQEAPQSTEAPKPVSQLPQTAEARTERVCQNGTYTIVLNERGDYRTLRLVDAVDTFGKNRGTQLVQYLNGHDNEADYVGFAFVYGASIKLWQKFQSAKQLETALKVLLSADKEQQIDYGHAYAVESGKCWRCGKKLTVPASINRGLGPTCTGIINAT